MTPGQDVVPDEADPRGAFVDLLGDVDGRDVLLVDGTAGPAGGLLREQGARVREHGRHDLPGLPAPGVDAVVIAAAPVDAAVVRAAVALLRPPGLLLLVGTRASSPLAWVDRWRGGLLPDVRARRWRTWAAAAGAPVRVEYGLLRSVAFPSTALDLHRPGAAAQVLRGSNALNTGPRRRAVDVLARLAERGLAGPLLPGLALLCSPEPLREEPVTGRIGVRGSQEVKLLRGDPPTSVEKVYSSVATARAEAAALEAVHAAWPGLAPRLLARPGPRRTRTSWVSGRSLQVMELSLAEGERWVLRAAGLLGQLHRRTGRPADGVGLLHGDYWLGNLLVDDAGTTIVGVIDWTEAGTGPWQDDIGFLVSTWCARRGLSADDGARLRAQAERAYLDARAGSVRE